MLDGIGFALDNNLTAKEMETEFIKPYGVEGKYLLKDRLYRCEDDIFEDMDSDERDRLFGKPAATVYDSVNTLYVSDEVESILCEGDVFNKLILNSYAQAMLDRWEMELLERIIPSNLQTIRSYKKIHTESNKTDDELWNKICQIKFALAKTTDKPSVFDELKDAIANDRKEDVSRLQLQMNKDMNTLKNLYKEYCDNQI